MPRVLIVCDGDDEPVLAVSSSFIGSPAHDQALELLQTLQSGESPGFRTELTPQSQIDRFDLLSDDE